MTYETALAAAKKAGRAWGCTCGEDNPPHYDACHACQRPSWTCATCGTVNTCGRSDCNECGGTMPAELLGGREEGFEMTWEEWINTQVGPRVVGGRYDHGSDASAYEVLDIERGPRIGWPVWQVTVRFLADGRESEHCSGWDASRDRVRRADQSVPPEPVGPGVDTIDVDPGDGIPQRWTAGTWNDRLARARRSGDPFPARIVRTFPEEGGR